MNKKYILLGAIVFLAIFFISTLFDSTKVNDIQDPDFTEDGAPVGRCKYFEMKAPSSIKIYVESSGSMNGFFRQNQSTQFKRDVWSVISSDLGALSDGVNVLSNDGDIIGVIPINDFRNAMNAGALTSNNETKVPTMLGTILANLNINAGEVAILISDMKYSPAGSASMTTLLDQYTEDIRNIVMRHKAAFSLIAAKSNYIGLNGSEIESNSPYYYLVIGHPDIVPLVRNMVATLVDDNGNYVEEFGFNNDYKTPRYKLKSIRDGIQKGDYPTIMGVSNGACSFKLSIDITNYRWIMADSVTISKMFEISSMHGSSVKVAGISISDELHSERQLKRQATADITIQVSGIGESGDVLEWILKPDEVSYRSSFGKFMGATSEGEYDKSFSIENFIEGCNRGSQTKWNEKKNKILISTSEE